LIKENGGRSYSRDYQSSLFLEPKREDDSLLGRSRRSAYYRAYFVRIIKGVKLRPLHLFPKPSQKFRAVANMSTKPTIILIPGAWHTTEGFGPLESFLEKAGYPTKAIDLPSAGAHPGHPDFDQDVAEIRKAVLDLIDEGKEVVVVMHSFGSVIGSEALRDLGKGDREAAGKLGGVVRCVFIGILLPELGKAMYETYMSVMSAPDLDPDFEVEQDQSSYVVAEVCSFLSSRNQVGKYVTKLIQ
jgi:pimeloyl-ACP methyl ester carboxylesterase